MKLSVTTALMASLAAVVYSSPLQKREIGGVLMCTGANSTGTCRYGVYEMNKCIQLPAPLLRNTNTFAVDGEDFVCSPHTYNCGEVCKSQTGCSFGPVGFDYKNKFNLSAISWNNLIASFDCHKVTKPMTEPSKQQDWTHKRRSDRFTKPAKAVKPGKGRKYKQHDQKPTKERKP